MPLRFMCPLARRNADLPCGRLDRPSGFGCMLARCVDYKTQLASEAINSATSLKQAVFGHLREF
jgi:hypothetical protein